MLLTRTAEVTGLTAALKPELGRWRKPLATHEPGKVVCDLALSLALGGDCLADLGMLRSEPGVYGHVASEATVSRTVTTLAEDADAAIRAISRARASARERACVMAADGAPGHGATAADPLVVDLDATIVVAHSEKEQAAGTHKRTYGFHPLLAFVDHGPEGTGEPLAILLRPGNAGSNTVKDHITVARQAQAQLPGVNTTRPGKKVLIRADGAGGTKDFTTWAHRRGLQYSVGFTLAGNTPDLLRRIPEEVWAPAYDAGGKVRPGADVAELTGLLTLTGWPPGMRVVARRERPHPGAQLRFEDVDGYRITAFATNTPRFQLADLELRHRRRARAEDRIRIWCQLVVMAMELTAWTQLLAFTGHAARRWEPKRLRHRVFTIPRDPGPHRSAGATAPEEHRALGPTRADRMDDAGRPCPTLTRHSVLPRPPAAHPRHVEPDAPGTPSGSLSYPVAKISPHRSP